MATSTPIMLEKGLIEECLKYHNYETAISLAEIRHAEEGSEASGLELGKALLVSGDAASAAGVLAQSGHSSPDAALLFARASLATHALPAAEDALLALLHLPTTPNPHPATPHAHLLLADIYFQTNRVEKAKKEWRRALELCPYLWPAYRNLANAGEGEKLNPSEIFKLRKGAGPAVPEVKLETPGVDKTHVARQLIVDTPEHPSPLLMPLNMDSPMEGCGRGTPVDGGKESSADSPPLRESLLAPKAPKKTRKVLGGTGGLVTGVGRRSTRSRGPIADENASSQGGSGAPTRRSPRFSAAPNEPRRHAPTRTMGLRNNNQGTARQTSSRLITPSPTQDLLDKDGKESLGPFDPVENQAAIYLSLKGPQPLSSETSLLNSLEALARVWKPLGQLRWLHAREEIERLPPALRHSPSCMVEEARTYLEMADYKRAVQIFEDLRRRYPWHLSGLEIYSTALWHLQAAAQLSALAQSLLPAFRLRPETWCVLGNAFSLHKDHDKAIRFLQRAVQLGPLPYAYTLLGHEFLALDNADKATQAFRTALRLNPRHYNAWFGLGEVCKRQEQLKLGKLHFERALAINPDNPILQCQMAEMEQALGRPREALAWLRKPATQANPICRFHRAQLLFATGNPQAALEELEELKRVTPGESRIFFLSGKIHSRLGQQHLSLIDYTWATELEPRGEAAPAVPLGLPYDPDHPLAIPHDPDA